MQSDWLLPHSLPSARGPIPSHVLLLPLIASYDLSSSPWRELEGTMQGMLLLVSLKGTVHENTLILQETKEWRFYHLSFKWWMNILSYFCGSWTVRAGEGCSEDCINETSTHEKWLSCCPSSTLMVLKMHSWACTYANTCTGDMDILALPRYAFNQQISASDFYSSAS